MAAAGQQIGVVTLFDDLAVAQDDNAVSGADGGEAMGDDDAGTAPQDGGQGGLHLGFGKRVDAGGRFIQEKDGRILQ